MQNTLLAKFLIITGLGLVLLIPLTMIRSIIDERSDYRDEAIQDIANSWARSQEIKGLILVFPYEEIEFKEIEEHKDAQVLHRQEKVLHQYNHYVLPKTLQINAELTPQDHYRGIYKAPGYRSSIAMKGTFEVPVFEEKENITWKEPFLVLGVSDTRGINSAAHISINDQQHQWKPGTKLNKVYGGIHTVLSQKLLHQRELSFNVGFDLLGMKELTFKPLGEFTQINLKSPWPHPSFIGQYLPKTKEITTDGFNATWETTYFSSHMLEETRRCFTTDNCVLYQRNSLGVSLHQGVDTYVNADRSIKYAILFVGLTFVAFFLFEVLKGLKIHPIQYGLVGISLSLFYLLLISLSEHMAFGIAYVLASTACTGLLGFYVSHTLKSFSRGGVFTAFLVSLYAALYIILQSEDYALLMGAFLLFAVLAFIMAFTRNIDWYQLSSTNKKQTPLPTQEEK